MVYILLFKNLIKQLLGHKNKVVNLNFIPQQSQSYFSTKILVSLPARLKTFGVKKTP